MGEKDKKRDEDEERKKEERWRMVEWGEEEDEKEIKTTPVFAEWLCWGILQYLHRLLTAGLAFMSCMP